jgi:hypothetical protein
MLLRLFHHDATACASYVFGCTTHATLAVVGLHVHLADSTRPAEQERIVAANRRGETLASA